jgi:hypothetical protein
MANKVDKFNRGLEAITADISGNDSTKDMGIAKSLGVSKIDYKGPIKKSVNIKEADNGYIVDIYAADFDATLVYPDIKKMLNAVTAFLRTEVTEG